MRGAVLIDVCRCICKRSDSSRLDDGFTAACGQARPLRGWQLLPLSAVALEFLALEGTGSHRKRRARIGSDESAAGHGTTGTRCGHVRPARRHPADELGGLSGGKLHRRHRRSAQGTHRLPALFRRTHPRASAHRLLRDQVVFRHHCGHADCRTHARPPRDRGTVHPRTAGRRLCRCDGAGGARHDHGTQVFGTLWGGELGHHQLFAGRRLPSAAGRLRRPAFGLRVSRDCLEGWRAWRGFHLPLDQYERPRLAHRANHRQASASSAPGAPLEQARRRARRLSARRFERHCSGGGRSQCVAAGHGSGSAK